MSHWRNLLMLNKLRAPVGNMQIFIRIRIRILHVVQSADPQSTDRILPVAWVVGMAGGTAGGLVELSVTVVYSCTYSF